MRSAGRRLAALLVTLGVTAAVAGLSRVPYDATNAGHALIRLSWRTPGELVNECRRPTAEELERTPVHMRREEVCEGRMVPYRLRVELDGRPVMDETVRAAGAREDRPLYVFREIEVPAGEHRLAIVWEREDAPDADPAPPAADDPDTTGADSGADTAAAGRAPVDPLARTDRRLTFDGALRLGAGEVALVTYDVDRRVFVARGPGGTPTPE